MIFQKLETCWNDKIIEADTYFLASLSKYNEKKDQKLYLEELIQSGYENNLKSWGLFRHSFKEILISLNPDIENQFTDVVSLNPNGELSLRERLIQLRTEREWTQKDLAKEVNVDIRTIRAIESGQTTFLPLGERLKKLAKAFGVEQTELLPAPEKTEEEIAKLSLKEQLNYFRLQKGWSPQDLEKKLKLSKGMVLRYETGVRFPSPPLILQFADLFGVDRDLLLESFEKAKKKRKHGSKSVSEDITMGQRVRRLRYQKGWTLTELGEKVGWSSAYVGAIERSKSHLDPKKAAKLALVLGTSKEFLFTGNDLPKTVLFEIAL